MSRYFYTLVLLLIQTEAFARSIRVDSCTIRYEL